MITKLEDPSMYGYIKDTATRCATPSPSARCSAIRSSSS